MAERSQSAAGEVIPPVANTPKGETQAMDLGYAPQWGAWTRHLMTVILIVAGLFFVTMLAPVIQMLTLAFLLAFLLFIPARALTRRVRLPYAVSVIVVYLILIVVIVVSILLLIPAMVDGVESLSNGFREGVARLETELEPYVQDGLNTINVFGVDLDIAFILDPVRQALGAYSQITQNQGGETGGELNDTPSTSDVPTTPTRPTVSLGSTDLRAWIDSLFSVAGTVTETLTSAIAGITGLVTSTLLALFISFLVLLDLPTSARALDRWVPDPYNREYSVLVQKIVRVWNGFFKGQVIIGVMIGVLTWLQLSLMGVAQPAVLAVIIGAISLIPTIGGFIALIPLAIVPLLNGSSVFDTMPNGFFALFVILVNLFISQIIWNVVAPKILGDALDLPLPVIIVGVFIGAAVGGVLGAFLVAPIMGTLRHLVLYVIAKINMRDPFPGEEAPFEFGAPMFDESEHLSNEIKPPTRATQGGR